MSGSLRVLAVVAVVLALLVAIQVPASAAAPGGGQQAAVTQTVATQAVAVMEATSHGCPFLGFCIYSGTNFSGSTLVLFSCVLSSISLVGKGSWVDNERQGTRATFYLRSGGTFVTPPAPTQSASYDFTNSTLTS